MLSGSMSVDRLVQSAGRSSFLGKELLQVHVYMYVHVCVCIHIYVYVYVYIHIYKYICIHI